MMGARGWHRYNTIPNEPLREAYRAYIAAGNYATDLCKLLGWDPKDTSRLARRLGAMGHQTSRARGSERATQERIELGLAIRVAHALGVDFDELYDGLLPPQPVDPSAGACEECGEVLAVRVEDQLCGWCREVGLGSGVLQVGEPVPA